MARLVGGDDFPEQEPHKIQLFPKPALVAGEKDSHRQSERADLGPEQAEHGETEQEAQHQVGAPEVERAEAAQRAAEESVLEEAREVDDGWG